MADREQNYKSHTRFLIPFHFFVIPVLVANVINEGLHLYHSATVDSVFAFVVALALLMLGFLARVQALTAQDRVIRLEMRLRLKDVLPADLRPRINEISTRHLVALRFACDAELPELVREVLAGRLDKTKDIKIKIKDWQADWQRV